VRNLPGVGPNDSIWIDLGYPAITLTTGKQVKPMFAILILDMDGRVNLNVSGNMQEQNLFHGSNQGLGRWEINPRQLMGGQNGGGAAAYWSLFWGNGTSVAGRYSNNPNPNVTPPVPNWPNISSATPSFVTKNYAGVDYDGSSSTNQGGGSQQIQIPQANQWTALAKFGSRWQGIGPLGDAAERSNHPAALFNPFRINLPGTPGGLQADHLFPISDMVHLMNPDPSFTLGGLQFPLADYSRSEIGTLWQANIANPQFPNLRNQITSFSMDVDRMGAEPGLASPFYNGPGQPGLYTFPQGGAPNEFGFPNGNQFSFNGLLAQRPNTAVTGPNPNVAGYGSDMRPNDWRSFLADIGLVDVNRPLTPFPDRSTPGGGPYQGSEQTQFQKAMAERAQLAYDIFTRFCTAVGLPDPNLKVNNQYVLPANLLGAPQNDQSPGQAGGLYESYRYLAQLAVNIVDYIDDDDVMTVFMWMQRTDLLAAVQRNRFVFGTEMPRMVINEVYAQMENDPNDPTIPGYVQGNTSDPDTPTTQMNPGSDRAFNGVTPPPPPPPAKGGKAYYATNPFRVNFWVGLHNPHNQDNNLTEKGNARLQINGAWSIYQVWIRSQVDLPGVAPNQRVMTAPWNVTGAPQTAPGVNNPNIDLKVMNFGQLDNLPPSNGQFNGSPNQPLQGFCVLAPGHQGDVPDWQAEIPHDRNGGFAPQPLSIISAQSPGFPQGANKFPQEWTQPKPGQMQSQLYGTVPPIGAFTTPTLSTIRTNNAYWPSVFLRRLAVPYLPPNEDPTLPNYNPYITVDYMEHFQIQDAVLYGGSATKHDERRDGQNHPQNARTQRAPIGSAATQFAPQIRASFGRRQPFSATGMSMTQLQPQATAAMVQNTFFGLHGASIYPFNNPTPGVTLDQPFQWYTHLDRQVVNPMELLEVSGYKPHLLTQTFIARPLNAAPVLQAHRAPWYNVPNTGYPNPINPLMGINATNTNFGPNDTRLYRLLGVLGTRDRTEGMAFGGRVPGKINLNTMTQEVFQALCDAQGGNLFTSNDVTSAWNNILNQRTPNGIPSPGDRPFTSVITTTLPADAQYFPPPALGGDNSTVMRDGPAQGTPLFGPSGNQPSHPYVQHELLRKIYGNLTTRSNTFAVFITTGFFDVRATPAGRPPVLGGEVDPSLRHRFFAIVDRTNLSVGDPARATYNQLYMNDNPPTVVDVRSQGNRPIYIPFDPIAPPPPPVGGQTTFGPWLSGVPGGANVLYATAYLTQNGASYTLVDQISQNGSPETLTITNGKTILYLDTGNAMERVLVMNVVPATPQPWNPGGVGYNLGDVVSLGPNTYYRCIRGNVSGGANAPPSGTYWEQINVTTPWYVLQLQPLQSAAPYLPGASASNHFRGCSLCTQIAGNPGPQSYPLPYSQAPYSNSVIPYQQILK
jgi:hypothetical protein